MHIGPKESSRKQACLTVLDRVYFAQCPAQLLRQGGTLSLLLNEASTSHALTRSMVKTSFFYNICSTTCISVFSGTSELAIFKNQ